MHSIVIQAINFFCFDGSTVNIVPTQNNAEQNTGNENLKTTPYLGASFAFIGCWIEEEIIPFIQAVKRLKTGLFANLKLRPKRSNVCSHKAAGLVFERLHRSYDDYLNKLKCIPMQETFTKLYYRHKFWQNSTPVQESMFAGKCSLGVNKARYFSARLREASVTLTTLTIFH